MTEDVTYADIHFLKRVNKQDPEFGLNHEEHAVDYSEVAIYTTDNSQQSNNGDLTSSAQVREDGKKGSDCKRDALLALLSLIFCIAIVLGLLNLYQYFLKTHHQIKYSGETRSKAPKCPLNWRFHGGKCYFFSEDQMTWAKSRYDCVSRGGHLVILNSQEEKTFLIEQVTVSNTTINYGFWIGLTSKKNGDWLWLDNTPFENLTNKGFWDSIQPDNWKQNDSAGRPCVRMWKQGFPESCTTLLRRICETASP